MQPVSAVPRRQIKFTTLSHEVAKKMGPLLTSRGRELLERTIVPVLRKVRIAEEFGVVPY